MSVCVCSLSYSACNAHAPYCHPWPGRLYNVFAYFLKNGTIFAKKITEYKRYIFIFSTTLSEMILIRRQLNEIWWRMFIGLHVKYPLFLSDCNETLIFTIFEKYSNVLFHVNPPNRNRFVRCRRTHDEVNSRFPPFCA